MLFADGWWRRTDDPTRKLLARPDDRNDVRIGFHHRLGRNRDLAIGDRTLKVYFRNMGANDQPFIDTFTETFRDRRREIAELLPTSAELTGNKRNLVVATYDIDTDAHEEFFEVYVAALREAFTDLVADNPSLVSTLDEAFYESIETVYGVPIDSR